MIQQDIEIGALNSVVILNFQLIQHDSVMQFERHMGVLGNHSCLKLKTSKDLIVFKDDV